MKEILDEFKEKICSTCKGDCSKGDDYKGITPVYGSNETKVKCVYYVKDESKIVKPLKEETVTARKCGPVMKGLV